MSVFFAISSNLLITFFFSFFFFVTVKISYMSWLLPYLFGTVLQNYLRGCLAGYGP